MSAVDVVRPALERVDVLLGELRDLVDAGARLTPARHAELSDQLEDLRRQCDEIIRGDA